MNLFQIILIVMAALIVAIWIGRLPGEIEKSKREKQQAQEFIQNKQKISDEDFINFLKGLRNDDKIYTTAQGAILNSKPHTFKDFINNQKLPSKLELIWEILADNDMKIKDIIQKIENNAPYSPDTKISLVMDCLKITPRQKRIMNIIKMYNQLINIDDEYPLYIEFTDMRNYHDNYINVVFQAGYGCGDEYIDRRHPARPTKH